MPVRVIDRKEQAIGKLEGDHEVMLLRLTNDIWTIAKQYAPVDSGALVTSSMNKMQSKTHYQISFNTPYATRRHFENFKNPQTLLYLQRAGDRVFSNSLERYLPR